MLEETKDPAIALVGSYSGNIKRSHLDLVESRDGFPDMALFKKIKQKKISIFTL